MKRFIDEGNVIAIVYDDAILAMMNVYCRFIETKEAYINNVEVAQEYQGFGLSKLLMDKSFEVIKDHGFQSAVLHVAKDNSAAVELYLKYKFHFTGEEKVSGETILHEMKKVL